MGSTESSGLVGDVDIDYGSETHEFSGSDRPDGASGCGTPGKEVSKEKINALPTTYEQKQAEIKRNAKCATKRETTRSDSKKL